LKGGITLVKNYEKKNKHNVKICQNLFFLFKIMKGKEMMFNVIRMIESLIMQIFWDGFQS
jgi:hypothetical protein